MQHGIFNSEFQGLPGQLAGKALVDGVLAAEATLMCKMVDRDAGQKEAGQKEKDAGK